MAILTLFDYNDTEGGHKMNREMLDAYIKQNGKIRVGVAGAGYIAKGFVNQAAQSGGIEIVAMSSRTRVRGSDTS